MNNVISNGVATIVGRQMMGEMNGNDSERARRSPASPTPTVRRFGLRGRDAENLRVSEAEESRADTRMAVQLDDGRDLQPSGVDSIVIRARPSRAGARSARWRRRS